MKRIVALFLLFAVSLYANSSIFQNIVEKVSIVDTQKAIDDAKILQKDINDKNFKNFIQSWKKVEANYLAGEIDSDFLDMPRFIDVFNNLKEDLNSQMKRAIESSSDIKVALFKNSFKTVNALEYVLYSNKDLSQREKDMAVEILNSIVSYLEKIKKAYENYLANPTKEASEENAIIINSLIASSYRLKEWRVGNPAGLSAKYKNDAKNNRAEYFLSQSSFDAIIAILEAQKELIEEKSYKNLNTLAKEKNALNDLNLVLENIELAKKELKTLPKDDFTNALKLFEIISKIHDLYYVTIIEKLGLKPEILDADGD
ncbi:imelysin family protein [Arcobacter vandammei]|uniref:imelysin family protein n=1 Tax=Arcobacter vandammei TaxID=2782243 RepID=UPI001D18210A|nr:imelysin family protein [Arcobacter vandammei]